MERRGKAGRGDKKAEKMIEEQNQQRNDDGKPEQNKPTR